MNFQAMSKMKNNINDKVMPLTLVTPQTLSLSGN